MRKLLALVSITTAALVAVAAACVPSYSFDGPSNDGGAGDATDAPPVTMSEGGGNAEAGGDAEAGPPPATYGSLAAGGDDTCLLHDGLVYCWGTLNDDGQLGSPTWDAGQTLVARPRPLAGQAQAFPHADEIHLSHPDWYPYQFACARSGPDAYCWGLGQDGERGDDGTGPAENGPNITRVPFLSGWQQLAVGGYHACGLLAPGKNLDGGDPGSNAYCWGYNGADALGPHDGLGQWHRVVGIPAMASIAAGQYYTCGITLASHTIYCWGQSNQWRAGPEVFDAGVDASNQNCMSGEDCTPRVVALPSGTPTVLALGQQFACAVTAEGAVWCWGADQLGQLGASIAPDTNCPFDNFGPGQCSSTPVKAIDESDDAVYVTAGDAFACALLRDHRVKCWGNGESGQIGNGTTTRIVIPAATVLDPTAAPMPFYADDVSAGASHICARKKSDFWCWGTPVFESDAGPSAALPQHVTFP